MLSNYVWNKWRIVIAGTEQMYRCWRKKHIYFQCSLSFLSSLGKLHKIQLSLIKLTQTKYLPVATRCLCSTYIWSEYYSSYTKNEKKRKCDKKIFERSGRPRSSDDGAHFGRPVAVTMTDVIKEIYGVVMGKPSNSIIQLFERRTETKTAKIIAQKSALSPRQLPVVVAKLIRLRNNFTSILFSFVSKLKNVLLCKKT